MTPTRSALLISALLLSGCPGNEELASLDDGVLHVELRRLSNWSSGGRLPTFHRTPVLVIQRESEELQVEATCYQGTDAELAGDGSGRLAYRCGTRDWSVVYLGQSHGFTLCTGAAGSGDTPLFDALPADLEAAIPVLGRCAPAWTRSRQDHLFDEAALLGEAQLVTVLGLTRNDPLWDWDERAEGLSETGRAQLGEELHDAIAESATETWASCRAMGLARDDDPLLLEHAAERLAEIASIRGGAGERRERTCRPALTRLLPIVREMAPERAGAAACTLLEGRRLWRRQGSTLSPDSVLESVLEALGDHPCEALAARLVDLRCEPSLRCDGELCTESQARAELADEPSSTRRVVLPLLLSAYARDEVPEMLPLTAARLRYSVARAPEETCSDIADEALVAEAVCDRASPRVQRCAVSVDDDRHQIHVRPPP